MTKIRTIIRTEKLGIDTICAFVSSACLLARRLIFYLLSSPQLRNKLFPVDFPVFFLQRHIKDEQFERSGNPLILLVIRLICNSSAHRRER